MNIASRDIATWFVGSLALLILLYVGQPLLVPLVFALLVWAVLNAFADVLLKFRLPRWFAWAGSLAGVAIAIYITVRIAGDDAAGLATALPGYTTKMQNIVTATLAPLRLNVDLRSLFNTANVTHFVGAVAASVGTGLLAVVQVLIYVGFLLSEQSQIIVKFARLQPDRARHNETQDVIRAIARQVQSYLGVCTVLSAIMALATYGLLIVMGVQFAGFWALFLFIVTYIPTIGAAGVALPALMALVQFGTVWPALIIVLVLGSMHFALMNVVEMVILGQTLNLSPFAIILALTFWGLVWGVAGLFLAVPVTGAFAIICSHVAGLRWISTLLGSVPPPRRRSKAAAAEALT
jgi:predicted PurR-regulated permease PerM